MNIAARADTRSKSVAVQWVDDLPNVIHSGYGNKQQRWFFFRYFSRGCLDMTEQMDLQPFGA